MSWRKISRGDALPDGLDAHRERAAGALRDFFTGGQERGETGARLDFLTGRADRSNAGLIRDLGGVKAAAAATGAAERTVRDWRAGAHSPTGAHLTSLERAAKRATVNEFGGSRSVASQTGVSQRQVQRWIRQRTDVSGRAAHLLNVAETRRRVEQNRTQNGRFPASMPMYLRAKGHVRVKATSSTPTYEADRDVHAEIDETTQDRAIDALARGDDAAVQAAVESALTSDYASLGDALYNAREGYGFFLDRIDETDMFHGPR
jgi:DNA-binding transcriptional regulator YiaG